jgi:hypothetical protein
MMSAAVLKRVDAKTMIPDLLRSHPEARGALDRYGLRGCGGPLGPMESLEFFARAHEAPLEDLLGDIREAIQRGPAATTSEAEPGAALADAIYRPFFKAGIAIVLTAGATWGALLLARIGLARSFTAPSLQEINAHGHAQIFGWVGLFVMGFAYQAFPRFKHSTLAHPRLAVATLAMMLAGIAARSTLEPLLAARPGLVWLALAGGALEVAAIGLFAFVIVRTLRLSGKPLAHYDWYILSALAWFILQAVCDVVYFGATAFAASREELLGLVSTWQAPLRDLQIHGFALLMILGVSQRVFPHFYGFAASSPRRSLWLLGALNLAVIGEAGGLVLMRLSGHAWAALWMVSTWALLGACGLLVWEWKLWRRPEESDRSLKFLRAAYVWLFVSLGMLVFLPVHQFGLLRWLAPESDAARMGFSHAYYGAIRHSITVGFVSLMIVGVSAKVVPTLLGVDLRRLSALWLPFVLLNTGCALRVGGQTLTDFAPGAFPVAGASGLLEVAGLAIWGIHLWRLMGGRVPAEALEMGALAADAEIGLAHRVGDILAARPELLEVFLAHGFEPLRSAWARQTLARAVSVGQACRLRGVSPDALLRDLNAATKNTHFKRAF